MKKIGIGLVVEIPEEIYQHYKKVWRKRRGSVPESCIAFGTPLPKHGKLIDADECKEKMIKYGFHAPDMTVTEFVEDMLTTVIPEDGEKSE